MYTYSIQDVLKYFSGLLQARLRPEGWQWLEDNTRFVAEGNSAKFYMAFTAAPRKVGKAAVLLTDQEQGELKQLLPDFYLDNYSLDRLTRVYLLLNWPITNKINYLRTIGELFKAAEMNELVSLYGALPLLAYPEDWVAQCAEGIRSNIGTVLESVICHNAYPAAYLGEPAWNQLVLKAIFTDQQMEKIVGLDLRANPVLAATLHDYVHERWAAGRTFNLQLWRNIAPFVNELIFADLYKIYTEGSDLERSAAVLACSVSQYPRAQQLFQQAGERKIAVENGQLTWDSLAKAASSGVLN